MNDFIADNPGLVFPLAAVVTALTGACLVVFAWRNRSRRVHAFIGALAGISFLFAGSGFASYYRVNRAFHELQQRTGFDVASYTFWTVGDGAQHQLGEFRGKPVLVYLWATTCGPCRPSLPALKKIASDLQGRAVVVLLSTESRDTLLEYAKKQDIPAIAAYSPDPRVSPGQSWAFPQAPRPTTFLIDRWGVVRRVMVGSRSGEHLRTLLTDLVASSTSAAVQQRDQTDGRARQS
jgi:thiol-disulfide isomerase/thioredoxin